MTEFAYITDIHLDEDFLARNNIRPRSNWEVILKDLAERNMSRVVFGGDIGDSAALAWFFDSLKPWKLHLTLGNHDNYPEVARFFGKSESAGDQLYYSFDEAGYRWVFLDSSRARLGAEQLRWLEGELTGAGGPLLLFIHHPVLEADTIVDRLYPLHDREQVLELLEQYGEDVIVFCGHYHAAEEKIRGNIRQILTLAASYQVPMHTGSIQVDGSFFGYRLVRINGSGISTSLVEFRV